MAGHFEGRTLAPSKGDDFMASTARRPHDHARRSAPPHAGALVRRPPAERDLLGAARNGDPAARRELVDRYLGLVKSIARRYRGLGLPAEDLVQEGAIGLLTAIDQFDPDNGAAFSTYAFWRIRQAVTHALTTNGHVLRLPKQVLEDRRAVVTAAAALANRGRTRSIEALAAATGLTREAVGQALGAPFTVSSLDEPLEDGTPLESAIADPAAVDPEAKALAHIEEQILADAVAHLPDRQRRVIAMHFGLGTEPQALSVVGDVLHVSPQRARALEHEALAALGRQLTPAAARTGRGSVGPRRRPGPAGGRHSGERRSR
jgi:RNA polymerase primary sigma factor